MTPEEIAAIPIHPGDRVINLIGTIGTVIKKNPNHFLYGSNDEYVAVQFDDMPADEYVMCPKDTLRRLI